VTNTVDLAPAKAKTTKGMASDRRVRDTHVRGTIKQRVRLALWAKSAGRCTLCNRRVLNDNRTYYHSIAAAEMAHILGATTTPGSPRGTQELDQDHDLESEDNLLLCCHDCHRLIDDRDHVHNFTPEKLRDLKARHEARIELATSDGLLTRTAVLRLGSTVRGTYTIASRREVADTLFANDLLGLVESQRSGHFRCDLAGGVEDDGYWDMARAQIGRTLHQVGQAVAEEEVGHISVFGIAPVPALVLLGASLDDKVETQLWQKHRDAGWSWPAPVNDPAVTFLFTADNHDGPGDDIVLVCSLSAQVDPSRLPAGLRRAPRLTLMPEGLTPTPTLLRDEKSLHNFAASFRDMLAAAEKTFPGATRWHLVAATPVAAAIEAGRAFMRDAQPPVDVYQRTGDGSYDPVLTINDSSGRPGAAAAQPGGRP